MSIDFKYIFIFLSVVFSTKAAAQNVEQSIDKINLEGIKKNDENYVRQFISSEVGKPLELKKLEQDIQQLRRLTGIANAEYTIDTLENNLLKINFQIREQRTLLPQFGIGGINNNFWWQVGLEEHNLFGRGQTLIANYLQNDGRANFKLFYKNQWVKGSPWGFAADLNRSASIEPLYFSDATVNFRYTNTGVGILGIRNLDLNRQVSLGANFFKEDYEKELDDEFPNSPGPDLLEQNKILLKAQYYSNKVTYDYFYRGGFEWNLLAQSVATLDDGSNFISLSFEGIKYWRPSSKSNIALRVRAAIATNRDSPFAPFVLDSRVNIRGVGNRIDRGTAQFVVNTEFRQTVFHTDRWAGQVIVFSDAGTWRNPGGDFKELFEKDQFRHFVGGGIRLINKKVFKSTLRIDYGFDLWNTQQNGIVFGVGQYF